MLDYNEIQQLEDCVIGCVLLRADNLTLLPSVEASDFRNLKAKTTWSAIRNLEASRSPIDVTTIADELAREGKLEAVGWDYLGGCAMRVPTVDNAIEYAHRLRDHALKARLLMAVSELIETGRGGITGTELVSDMHKILSALDVVKTEEAKPVSAMLDERFKQLDVIARERAAGICTLTGFPTGVAALDEKIGGWQPGIVSIVAARPGMGKSSLGLATADAASAAGHGVHLFSLEDTEASYADRVLSRKSGVPAENMRNSTLDRGNLDSIRDARSAARRQKNWLIDSRSGVTSTEIVRSARRRMRDNGTKVVIIDYVQMVAKERGASSHESLTEIVTAFANAAKQDGIAYVVMSQLNRQLESRTDKRPQLSDLRESGSLEERAKCVVAMYRGSVYGKAQQGIDYREGEAAPNDEKFKRTAQLIVLKNSNGRTGHIFADWDGPTTRIS